MDNQQSNEGNARDIGREGAGSSMGGDQNSGRSEAKDNSTTGSFNLSGNTPTGNMGSTGITSAAGSTGSIGNGSSIGNTGASSDSRSRDSSKGVPPVKASDVHKTIDKAAEAAKPMVDRLASRAHTSVDKMSGMLGGASQTMSERSQQLNEAYRQVAESGREYVRNKPGTAVAIALGAGFLLAKMFNRRT